MTEPLGCASTWYLSSPVTEVLHFVLEVVTIQPLYIIRYEASHPDQCHFSQPIPMCLCPR